jgi:hypothetical protein
MQMQPHAAMLYQLHYYQNMNLNNEKESFSISRLQDCLPQELKLPSRILWTTIHAA